MQVKFKPDFGTLWIKATVVKKVLGGYIIKYQNSSSGYTELFMKNRNVKPL